MPPEVIYNTPLAKKLGIKPRQRLRAYGAPDGFVDLLGMLPEGAAFTNKGNVDFAFVFATSALELEIRFERALRSIDDKGRVAMIWPKKTTERSPKVDIDGNRVREYGISMGWVDYKVCSVDATWSALVFAPKK